MKITSDSQFAWILITTFLAAISITAAIANLGCTVGWLNVIPQITWPIATIAYQILWFIEKSKR